jgi:deoxyribodipyrimidine photolyase
LRKSCNVGFPTGVTLGKTYLEPIIDHKAGRESALAAKSQGPRGTG